MKPFPHIPAPSESQTYFYEWLQANPIESGVSRFFGKLFNLNTIIEVISIDILEDDGIRTLLRSVDGAKTLVDLWFGHNPHYRQESFSSDIALENRFSLTIDLLRNKDSEWKAGDGNCPYQRNRTIGVTTFSTLLPESHDPSFWLYESSIRWMAKEHQKDSALHMGDSAITMANFMQKRLHFQMKDRFGNRVGAEARILDASTASVCLYAPLRLDFDVDALDRSMTASLYLCFDYSVFSKVIRPYLSLAFTVVDEGQEDSYIKKDELYAFAKEKIKSKQEFGLVDSASRWSEATLAIAKPYNLDLFRQKGRTEFEEHLYALMNAAIDAFRRG